MTTNTNALGDLVKVSRLAKSMNQTELGKKAGVTQRTISKIELGLIKQPRTDVLMRLAWALDLTAEDVHRAAGMTAGNMSIDSYFDENDVPPDVQASFHSLAKLSPSRMRQAKEMIDVLAAMDDAEFQRGDK